MRLQFDRCHEATSLPGFRFQIRRISLAQRLRFLAANHDIMQRLKFLGAAVEKSAAQQAEIAGLELDLSRALLQECLVSLGEGDQTNVADPEAFEWLLNSAPAGLCVEVLSCISDEISLSEQRRKN